MSAFGGHRDLGNFFKQKKGQLQFDLGSETMNSVRKVVFHSAKQEDAEKQFLERRRHLAEYRRGLLIVIVLIVLFSLLSILMIMVSWQGALGVLYLLPSH